MSKYFTRVNAIRLAGFLGAAGAAGAEALAGNYVTAFGILAAAVSTAGLKGSTNVTHVK